MRDKLFIVVILVSILSTQNLYAQQYEYPFQNPKLSVEKRVDNIISLLTIDEKIDALSTDPSVPRLGIKGSGHVEGLHGLAQGGPANWTPKPPIPTTQFPQARGMGNTWDPAIMKKAGQVEGYEARYIFQNDKYHSGGLVIRAPNTDLARDPRWGRNEESYGEDPYLVGTMASAFIQGLQGNDSDYWQTASLMKHFLANSNEDTRSHSSSNFDERLLREYYDVPFRMGVEKGGSDAYMAAYNAYNGIPMMVNPILKNITEKEWGLNGIICSDGGALHLLVSDHKYYNDLPMAAAKSVKAGISQFLDTYRKAIHTALDEGLLTEKDIDRVIRGNFRIMIKLGLLDPPSMVPYAGIGKENDIEPWKTEKHKEVARQITRESVVLLKNKNHFLPLDKNKKQSIAVIGRWADNVLLDWYSGLPPYRVTPLEGIKNKVGKGVSVRFAKGNGQDSTATKLARSSDLAIVVVGNHPTGNRGWGKVEYPSEGKEAVDRKSITLEQEKLIREVYRANRNVVVVLISSFPYAITWTDHNVPAIVHLTQNSQELGNALADVLFGDYNPAGRLTQTWPRSLDQLPPLMDYNIRHGRTYQYFQGKPLYPFGYGLSYTTFGYSNLKLSSNTLSKDGVLNLSVDVTNTGSQAGDEVVQMYIKHLNSNIKRPKKELKGFRRVHLAPQQTKTVEFVLKGNDLAYWNENFNRFDVEKDKIRVMIGHSASDIRTGQAVNIIK